MNFKDVLVHSVEKPSSLKIRHKGVQKASKTDPFRQGVDIFVGRTGDQPCPVAIGIYGLERVQVHCLNSKMANPLLDSHNSYYHTKDKQLISHSRNVC